MQRGGKHDGKFYIVTAARKIKLVAKDAAAMSEWVDAINGARLNLDMLARSSRSTDTETADDGGGGVTAGTGGTDTPDCVRAWRAAVAQLSKKSEKSTTVPHFHPIFTPGWHR